ncbi:MAG: hypothetical protein Fur0040_11390 [Sideroxydans sp.]
MSFAASDLVALKWNLAALATAVATAAWLVHYGEDYKQQALREKQAAQARLTEARAQLATAQSDFENMATYQLEYDALVNQKVIGDEQRLDWIEGLEQLRKQGIVRGFKYTIGPQQGYTPNPPQDAGNFALHLSPMTMQIELLHEGQLDDLFAAIQTQMQGWFMLDGCSLTPGAAPGEPLKAECSGGWLTMKNRNAS